MAKIELRHYDHRTDSIFSTIELWDVSPVSNEQAVKINVWDNQRNQIIPIIFDVSTAIRFAKTLRTKINEAKEVGNV